MKDMRAQSFEIDVRYLELRSKEVRRALGEVIGWVIDQYMVAVALAKVISRKIIPLWHCISSIVRYHIYYMTGWEEQTARAYEAFR